LHWHNSSIARENWITWHPSRGVIFVVNAYERKIGDLDQTGFGGLLRNGDYC